ncbi:DUF2256 domain-containing protein [Candidatus Gracilibacteria bacterium]|nr:DUF2256 domain-containing protein [Candidatus Gracilibacteria bacterium]
MKNKNQTLKILDRGQIKQAKLCLVCEKPFTIRKKWKNNFNEVFYCSERCRRNKTKK